MEHQVGRLLPALKGGKERLSDEQLKQAMALNGPRPLAFLRTALLAWLVIIVSVWAAVASANVLVYAVAIVMIASRMNVFGLLIHDQTHMGLGGKYGDWIANILCGYPMLGISVEGYSQVHLAHHRDFFKENDPDFIRKSGEEWSFPKTKWEMAKLFLKDLTLINTGKLIKGKKVPGGVQFERKNPTPKWIKPVMLVALAIGLTWTGTWLYFLALWIFPLFGVLAAFVRWGAICEHEYNIANVGVLESTPLIVQTWLEKIFVPNLNFGMHPYHHIFPGVSFSELPKLHKIFQDAGLVDEKSVFNGNLSFLKYLLGGSQGKEVGV